MLDRDQTLGQVQVVEIGACAALAGPHGDGHQGADLAGGFAGVGQARVAFGLKVVVGRDDQSGIGQGCANLAGDRLQVAGVEGDHHAVPGGHANGAARCPALGDHHGSLLVRLAQDGVRSCRGRSLEE